jgi:hypothetical protein
MALVMGMMVCVRSWGEADAGGGTAKSQRTGERHGGAYVIRFVVEIGPGPHVKMGAR